MIISVTGACECDEGRTGHRFWLLGVVEEQLRGVGGNGGIDRNAQGPKAPARSAE